MLASRKSLSFFISYGECRQARDEPLMYSQFCHYIQQDEEKHRATMHVPRKPGEQVEVDWAGDPAQIIDPDTGEITKAWIFIGVMTYSQYTYAEAFVNQQETAWIKAHVHMYEYFGGVACSALAPFCYSLNCKIFEETGNTEYNGKQHLTDRFAHHTAKSEGMAV